MSGYRNLLMQQLGQGVQGRAQQRQRDEQDYQLGQQLGDLQMRNAVLQHKQLQRNVNQQGKPQIVQHKDGQGRLWNMKKNPDGSLEPVGMVGGSSTTPSTPGYAGMVKTGGGGAPQFNTQTKKLTPAQEALAPFLPPELDPMSATTKDWVMARESQKAGKAPDLEVFRQKEEIKAEIQSRNAKEKPPTGEQSKARGFYDRMQSAQTEIDSLGDFNPVDIWEKVQAVGGNITMSPELQRYNQAANDWIRAKLRKESGAVIGDREMATEYETYFPQFGDSQEVIAQKARARKVAEKAMFDATGRPGQQSSGGPVVGDVDSGYRYKGGDPSDPSSWEEV